MRRNNTIFIGLLWFFLVLGPPSFALAVDIPQDDIRSTGPCMGEEGFADAWLDRTHVYLNKILCQPSVWFDNFFGEQRVGNEWPGSLVTWKNSYRLDEKEDEIFLTRIDADLRLPNARRLRLVIESERSEDNTDILASDKTSGAADPISESEKRRTTVGFRFLVSESRRTNFNLGVGVRFDTPLDPYVRTRLRITEPIGPSSLIRITPSATLYRDEGLSRSLRLDIERRVGENILLRASETGSWKEGLPGIQWGTELSFLERLSPKTVLNVKAGAKGQTQPFVYTDRYRLSFRVRKNVYRPWFFVELEPELYWPRDEEGNYRKYHALTFRAEIQFFS